MRHGTFDKRYASAGAPVGHSRNGQKFSSEQNLIIEWNSVKSDFSEYKSFFSKMFDKQHAGAHDLQCLCPRLLSDTFLCEKFFH